MTRIRRALVAAAIASVLVVPSSVSSATPFSARRVGAVEISKDGGLGRVELHKDLAAVLQRDEGIVSLVDVSRPSRPKVVGRYDNDAQESFDGDLAFSSDGKWLFYARQTHEFSMDGVHVLDVSDPANPSLASYQPAGGTLRIGYFDDGDAEWVVIMDAIDGMVVYRFEPTTGSLVPVHVSPLPPLKVGGPASAGVVITRDPILDIPLLYAATGRTGVEVYDFSDPTDPQLLGEWPDLGLAEIEVRVEGKKRTIYGASEYWFAKQQEPVVVQLDASKLDRIRLVRTYALDLPPEDRFRVQGLALYGDVLYAAHSETGLVAFAPNGGVASRTTFRDPRNKNPGVIGEANYTFDVEVRGAYAYVTDAATGVLSILKHPLTVRVLAPRR